MRILGCGALAAGLLLAADQTAAATEQCNLTEFTRVDLTYDPAGGPVIPVTLDGQPRSMLVDTGSIYSTVTEQTVSDLHLTTEQLPIHSFELADGKYLDQAAKVSEIIIGHMRGRDWPFVVIPQSEPGAKGWAGTIGPDIMASYDVEFDFGAGKFALFSHDHCPGEVVYWTKDGYASLPIALGRTDDHIHLTAMLDGKSVNVIIDTGSSTSAMNYSTVQKLFGIAPSDPALEKCATCAAGSPGYGVVRYPFKTLSFGGVTVSNPNIIIFPDTLKGIGTDEQDQMIVGVSILRQLHLYISYREKTLYVTGAGAH